MQGDCPWARAFRQQVDVVGLEFSLAEMVAAERAAIAAGALQVMVTTAVVAAIAAVAGISWPAAWWRALRRCRRRRSR